MATTTTNLGLIEPAGQDRALVANINTNSEKIDAEAGKVRDNFALVQNGNTATQAISKDQLVVWKGVLKKATANIASGATLSGSNLSDDTIAAELAALNSKIAKFDPETTSQAWFGNVPSGKDSWGNVQISVPFENPNKVTPTITAVTVTNSQAQTADITNAVTVSSVTKSFFSINFANSYGEHYLRVEFHI